MFPTMEQQTLPDDDGTRLPCIQQRRGERRYGNVVEKEDTATWREDTATSIVEKEDTATWRKKIRQRRGERRYSNMERDMKDPSTSSYWDLRTFETFLLNVRGW